MSAKAKFQPGQFATVNRYIAPVFPSGTLVEVLEVSGDERSGCRYRCKEHAGVTGKTGWVDERDLD